MNMDEIYNSIRDIREAMLVNLGSVKARVNSIIVSRNRDANYIERVFDELLDYMSLCYYEVKPMYLRLLEYTSTFDIELTNDYISIFNKMFDNKRLLMRTRAHIVINFFYNIVRIRLIFALTIFILSRFIIYFIQYFFSK